MTLKINEYVKEIAKKLEKFNEIKIPEWAKFVKTSCGKERIPEQKNWWYLRSASILRKIDKYKYLGVNRARNLYKVRKNYGHAPEHKVKAGGKIIRTIFIQLEKAGLVEKTKKGRKITKKGKELLKSIGV